jgi:hypothetical protein
MNPAQKLPEEFRSHLTGIMKFVNNKDLDNIRVGIRFCHDFGLTRAEMRAAMEVIMDEVNPLPNNVIRMRKQA